MTSLSMRPFLGIATALARPGFRVVVSLLAGASLAAASAPWEQAWLLPIGVAAFVAVVGAGRVRSSFLLGYLFGAGYVLMLTSWMRAVGVDAWLIVGGAAAIYYGLLGTAIALVRRLPCWPIWVACLWAAVEILMSTWPLGGFPWARLAWATAETPLALWFPWVGATGVSLLVSLSGSVLVWLVVSAKIRPRIAVAALFPVALVALLPTVIRPHSLGPTWQRDLPSARVAVVQGDVPGAGDDLVAVHREVTANQVAATAELGSRVARGVVERPDFVLWPENSTAVDPFNDAATHGAISSAVAAVDVPILVGAIVDDARPDTVLNQGIVWTPGDGVDERYTKRHPVPFGEYIPFRSWLAGLKIGRLSMIPRDMVPGARSTPLDINGFAVADLICFDVAFDDSVAEQVRQGAQMIAVQTSNATFIKTAQPQQQFTISRLRAMETGRTVAVASTNGISGLIAPDGSIRSIIAPQTTDVLVAEIPLQSRLTLATMIGEPLKALVLGSAGAALAWVGVYRLHRRRSHGRTEGESRAEKTMVGHA
jgi:apolipoprotein N-acyltransferase